MVEWGIHGLGRNGWDRARVGDVSLRVSRVVDTAAKLLKMPKLPFACHVAGRERVKIYQDELGA
jgi:hypothetical protein